MKIIDILNEMANGTLKDKFKFKYNNKIYQYYKANDRIYNCESGYIFGSEYIIDLYLNDEVQVIEENKEIEELNYYTVISAVPGKFEENVDKELKKITNKLNELVRAYKKLIKENEEREEK